MIRFLPGIFMLVLLTCADARAQGKLITQLKISETAPEKLLSTRSLVLYENTYKQEELSIIQKAFQQIGIDADFYLDAAKVAAGVDTERAYATYFTTREIAFLIFLTKSTEGYNFYATEYSNTPQFVTAGQFAWKVTNKKIDELLATIYRDSWLREKKQNFLINDIPEMDITVPIIAGRRSELFPIDLRIDKLAIPKPEEAAAQADIDTLFRKIYPYPEKYQIVSLPADEKDLVKQGFQYLLLCVNVNGKTARELLGYDMTRNLATAYGSVTYPNGAPQVKTISVEEPVYKFYIKHIRSGNVFLGTKWDADQTFIQALKNHIMGFRTELKLN